MARHTETQERYEQELARVHRNLHWCAIAAERAGDEGGAQDLRQLQHEITRIGGDQLCKRRRPPVLIT
jgi:hypothetical protein